MVEEAGNSTRMDRLFGVVSGISAAGGSLILFVCGVLSFHLPLAKELFTLCLLVGATCAVLFYRQGNRLLAGMVATTFIGLLLLSFLPVYVRHWTPWDGQYHRHTLWGFDHVH